jgi:acyl-coenzyme A thioesterase PaaI-like protein
VLYLKPAGTYDLTSKSKIIRKGKKVNWLESEVFSNDELVAKATASFAIY